MRILKHRTLQAINETKLKHLVLYYLVYDVYCSRNKLTWKSDVWGYVNEEPLCYYPDWI